MYPQRTSSTRPPMFRHQIKHMNPLELLQSTHILRIHHLWEWFTMKIYQQERPMSSWFGQDREHLPKEREHQHTTSRNQFQWYYPIDTHILHIHRLRISWNQCTEQQRNIPWVHILAIKIDPPLFVERFPTIEPWWAKNLKRRSVLTSSVSAVASSCVYNSIEKWGRKRVNVVSPVIHCCWGRAFIVCHEEQRQMSMW